MLPKFVHQVSSDPATGSTHWVSYSNSTTIYIQFIQIQIKFLCTSQSLSTKRFIDLSEIT